jgi:curved DNA-binding protein CbpA
MRSIEVESLDSSGHGVGISSPVEVSPGTTVFLEAKNGSTRGYATARRCVLRDLDYVIGLEFDEAPSHTNPPSSPTADFDYYEFLQISPKAEMGTIQRIYRFMAGRFHPDNPVTGDPEKFLLLKHAYEVLSDPGRRADYDATRENREVRPNPIFEMGEFVNGIEGETNRRLGVLALLYGKRRNSPEDPKVSLYDLEKRMGWPREYLDFTTWYLRSMKYITREDNSDFALTALGVDFVEQNYTKIPMLQRLLNSGSRTTTSAAPPDDSKHPDPGELFLMRHVQATDGETAGGGEEKGNFPFGPPA